MAQQTIGVGSVADDNTGDTIRDAFVKVNANFTELYTDDAGDVNSVTAGTGLTGTATTGALTINAIGGDGITANADELEVSVDGSTIELSATNGSGAVRIKDLGVSTAKLAADAVDGTKIADDSINSEHYVDGSIDTAHLADNQITYDKLGIEFTESVALSSATAIAVNTSLGDVFTFTAGHSATLNFTDVGIGDIKTFVITGGGGSYTLTLGTINGSSGTYNALSTTAYSDTGSAKNLVQIKFVSTSEAWYQISQIAS